MTTYREDNWSFDPEIDLDYENKFFEIIFDSTIDIEKIDKLWRFQIKYFLEKGSKGIVLSAYPNPSIVGFILEDISKEFLVKFLNELEIINIPEAVSIIRYKNQKDNQIFKSFHDFQSYIKNLT
ncbi:MAG: hypothetical protein K9L98_02545 [Candidatus Pacebacteria bacterium]|nr:hypothetical protein [Candidatus Paceibacterota bacterium]MCF7862865.1 hypothetical protein [Candidatus Paceibacterota bacterium]